ncbi:subclass B1 metallo-beta-lactamase, long type [uncultured Cohaesibacter sp.]|uniref:subclass B1 metallo-beta-lactamase, long type n=1 Tax=uncultured Cohaesibacter sp. TaxID=1002546 RepID=UPI00292ED139|nr:subclass B1 metallo-beta-lactamase, long type [uncultured Cohaesibacter sp.]
MRSFILSAAIMLTSFNLFSPEVKASDAIALSDSLSVTQLTENTFIHTSDGNNGLVYFNEDQALVVSTPATDRQTQDLIDWITNDRHKTIVGYVVDRWHPDAMGGLAAVHANGITSYAYARTAEIAKEKGLPVPQKTFQNRLAIKVGSSSVLADYLGKAHTEDGIVVWVPEEQVLFGGNEIRNNHGWVGNIGDASLRDWSTTARRVKQNYGSARIVIPGHGSFGGPELIDYTINLFEPFSANGSDAPLTALPSQLGGEPATIVDASQKTLDGDSQLLKDAVVLVQDKTKYLRIEAPAIKWNIKSNRMDTAEGHLAIYDKISGKAAHRASVHYKKLIVTKVDDSVGLAVIIKSMTPD